MTPIFRFGVMQDEEPPELFYIVEWIVDISWCVEIICTFVTVDDRVTTVRQATRDYLMFFFWVDIIATLPSMANLQHSN